MKKNNTDPIEQLLSDTFDDYSVPEFKNSWTKIKTKVLKHQLLKFNLYQFNIYYGAIVAGAIIAAGAVLIKPYVPPKATDNTPETEISNITDDEEAVLPERANQKEVQYDKLHNMPPYTVEEEAHTNDEPRNNEEQKKAVVNSSDNNKTENKTDEIVQQEAFVNDTVLGHTADEVKYEKTDSDKVESSRTVAPNDSVEVSQTNTLIRDSINQRKVIKKIIVTDKPVVKRDTIIKVVRKRRRKK
jgi:hypothetical protein